MSSNFFISTDTEYRSALAAIEPYLSKGFENLSASEEEDLSRISEQIEDYETKHYFLPFKPKTLLEMIEYKMFELKLKQRDLAKLLGVTENRISEVMNGKRHVNMDLAKKINQKLNIDAQFILNHA